MPYQWVTSCFTPTYATPEVRADIKTGNLVTVVGGSDQLRTGLVLGKSENGTVLSVYEFQTRKIVSV